MSNVNFSQPISPNGSTTHKAAESHCAVATHRGDVTTVQAAAYVRLQETKRIEKLQAHAPPRTERLARPPCPSCFHGSGGYRSEHPSIADEIVKQHASVAIHSTKRSRNRIDVLNSPMSNEYDPGKFQKIADMGG
jgi:hypothetical protein